MNLFPIGAVSDSDSTGTFGTFFEPNSKVNSSYIHNVQTLTLQNITINTYKKQEPFRKITYEYKDIFDFEYEKIKKFSDLVEGGLNSFFVVDLGLGTYIGTVSAGSLTVPYSSCYSTLSSVGAYYSFAWNGVDFMIGAVDSSSTGHITISHQYGETSVSKATIYPIYEVYVAQGDFDNFSTTVFYKSMGTSTVNTDHGWMRDGTLNFISKYPSR